MSTWYHRCAFAILRKTYIPRAVRRYSVEFTGNQDEPEGPHLLIANHQHMDDAYVLGARMRDPVMAMADREASSALQVIGGLLLGLYFRRPGVDDTAAIRRTRELLNAGHPVGIFPSGAMSWDGSDGIDYRQTAKLARLLRVPLRIARIKGLYLAGPRWAAHPRIAKVGVELSTIPAEELASMSSAELADILRHRLAHDEIPALRGAEVRGEAIAEGVQNLIWHCPACDSFDGIEGNGNEVRCSECGESWPLRGDLSLPSGPYADLKEWHDAQLTGLDRGPQRVATEGAALEVFDPASGRRRRSYADVTARAVSGAIEIRGQGEEILRVPLSEIRAARVLKNRSFCFSAGEERYRLVAPGRNLLKWLRLWERMGN
jgi:1-acyl-sn-glycerol-3-phosphate acyltransferase